MEFLKFFLFLLLLSGCAKIEYMVEQGSGQIALFNKAKPVHEYIQNPLVPKKNIEKLKLIEEYKKYFLKYWNVKENSIYSKVTQLESKAVTYLVISTPFNEIKPKEECFPFVGCFPYLGFFKKDSASKYAEKLESQNLVTYIRPVLAYSTLGHFNDPILSSFFEYDDFELSILIFHELFHTLFFVKSDVDFNENLAEHFSHLMADEYFGNNELYKKWKIIDDGNDALMQVIVEKAKLVNQRLLEQKPKNKKEAEVILSQFLEIDFKPALKQKCQALSISEEDCHFLKKSWNQARFAAVLTYEKDADTLKNIQKKRNLSTKDFFKYIQSSYQSYNGEELFSSYFKKTNL